MLLTDCFLEFSCFRWTSIAVMDRDHEGVEFVNGCECGKGQDKIDQHGDGGLLQVTGGKNRIAIDVSFRLLSTVHLPAP